MSNKVGNMNTIAPTSTMSSAKKPRKLIVRQTLTSKLRAERGDKLQFIKNEIQKLEEKKEKLTANSTFKKPNPVNNMETPSHRPPVSTIRTAPVSRADKKEVKSVTFKTVTTKLLNNNKPMEKDKLTKIRPNTAPTCVNNNLKRPINKPDQQKDIKTPKFSLVPNQIRQNLTTKFNQDKNKLSENEKPRRQTVMFPTKKTEIKKVIPPKPALKTAGSTSGIKKSVTVKSPFRKSLTAIHFKKVTNCNRNNAIHRTVSWSDGLSPINQSPQEPIFRTPTMAKRRSIFVQTPMSMDKKSSSPFPFSIISTPTTSDLKRRLNLWLEKRGKPLDSFHHLRCFGIKSNTEIVEENKENFEVFIPDKNSSYEDLKIKVEEKPIEEMSIANDAMYDLHKLILENYPREQCEAWLELIVSRFSEVQEKPQYWECRAALEEARGNYKNAIDCYANAISKGAEVEQVNDPLDNLLEKFSVLNISHIDSNPQKTPQKMLDSRNIFKSSIICFAIQERDRKSTEDGFRFTATPVRRSTRQSRSHFVTTPKVRLSTTLQDLEDPVHFQTNKAFQ